MHLIVSDRCRGLVEAAAEFYRQVRGPRCVGRWYRNIFSDVPTTTAEEIAAMFEASQAPEDAAAAQEKRPPWWKSSGR